jgi:hypothetical protein
MKGRYHHDLANDRHDRSKHPIISIRFVLGNTRKIQPGLSPALRAPSWPFSLKHHLGARYRLQPGSAQLALRREAYLTRGQLPSLIGRNASLPASSESSL